MAEHTDLIESIRAGEPLNERHRVAESTLIAIMGREACYTGKVVLACIIHDLAVLAGPDRPAPSIHQGSSSQTLQVGFLLAS